MAYTDSDFDGLLYMAVERAAELDFPDILPVEKGEVLSFPIKKKRRGLLRKIAVIAAVLAALTGVVFANPEARAFISNLLTTWFPDHVEYRVIESTTGMPSAGFEFSFIPEDYLMTSENVSAEVIEYMYTNSIDNRRLTIRASSMSGAINIDNENRALSNISHNGISVDVYEGTTNRANNTIVIKYDEHGYILRISAYEDIDTLLKIFDGIE